jgi:hypothetical protein
MQMLKIVNPHKYFVAQACRQNKEKPQLSSAARFLPTCFSLFDSIKGYHDRDT